MTTVLITGANRGLGLALAQLYAADRADVIVCCRDPENADALKQLAASSGGRVQIIQLDVTDLTSIASLKDALGDRPIDILINNAGINGTPKVQSADCIDAEGWINTLRINALSPVLIAQALRDNLRRSSEKKLVAISSDLGSTGVDYGATSAVRSERYAYRASKAALNNGMRGLARDWAADGVVVGILNPGFVRTDMTGARGAASSASISAEESARGLIRQIAGLTRANSGTFWDYRGETIAW
ncbi:SDR family oxidoreductase [Bradyrhizobium sp. CW10]|uniref:SDR family oxidoreductase n=1 Tax=Bradyrhizobium sp. CW10 TaxID=2782683 RepID=UPI001FF740D0|nr:SDR family oxidoreductase [Bradyrhizobium sp. CW10]MCK1467199.1 SDR family oxidoreductase [Bradyrhizobium sp. CW10]